MNLNFILNNFLNYTIPELIMRGELKGGKVILPFSQRLYSRGIGEKMGKNLILSVEEAAYLHLRSNLEVYSKNKILQFEDLFSLVNPVKFFVYEDLRERGVRIKFDDFGNYIPIHENYIFKIRDLSELYNKKIAIVDGEGEVSYFLIEKFNGRGKHLEEIKKFKAKFANGFFITDRKELFRKYFYGTEKGNRVILSIFEALYLMEKGIMDVEKGIEKIYEFGREKIKDFDKKYKVYKDLRLRNFMVKTGFKFGSEFRVYDEIKSLAELGHSNYLVKIKNRIPAFELAGDVRLSTAVNKSMIYPIFKGKKIEYVSVRRVKF